MAGMTVTPPVSLYSSLGVQPTASLLSLLSPTTGSNAGGLYGGSTIVELSGLGQLLSATALFQNNLANLQPGSANSGLGQNFGTDFGSLAAEAQNFVDTFNTLQSTLAGLQSAYGPLAGDALTTQFSQALDTRATATQANGGTAPTTLADIGITLQTGATGGTLSIDLQALQAAYQANPTGTFSLLAQAAQSLGNVAANYASQAGAESTTLAGIAQADSQLSLLFGSGLTGSSSFGLADLLALSSMTSGSTGTLTQQLLALNEFNLVSTLIG